MHCINAILREARMLYHNISIRMLYNMFLTHIFHFRIIYIYNILYLCKNINPVGKTPGK